MPKRTSVSRRRSRTLLLRSRTQRTTYDAMWLVYKEILRKKKSPWGRGPGQRSPSEILSRTPHATPSDPLFVGVGYRKESGGTCSSLPPRTPSAVRFPYGYGIDRSSRDPFCGGFLGRWDPLRIRGRGSLLTGGGVEEGEKEEGKHRYLFDTSDHGSRSKERDLSMRFR